MGLQLSNVEDKMVWSFNVASGQITVKLTYQFLVDTHLNSVDCWWHKELWIWKIPMIIKCFTWLYLNDKVNTWDNLLKK